jgi:hypothetical protein
MINIPSARSQIVPKLKLALYDCRITYPERWGRMQTTTFGIFGYISSSRDKL